LPRGFAPGGRPDIIAMIILHVTDFHFNKHWFEWLLVNAPPHDLLAMSGDMLDLTAATPHGKQIAWVSSWLNEYPGLLSLCSGNHDLEWNSESERWTPAYWLRDLTNPNVWIDGQRITPNGLSILNIGCTTRPKGGEADVWIVHAPPSGTRTSRPADGGDQGDPDLVLSMRRHAPRLVLSGHVHEPVDWQERCGPTLILNPGFNPRAPFPNHTLINTDTLACNRITASNSASGSTDGAAGIAQPAFHLNRATVPPAAPAQTHNLNINR